MYILRNKFLGTTAAFLSPPNEGEEDNRSEAQKQRDAIEVSDSTTKNNNENNENTNENEEENNEEEENENNNEENDDENDDEDEEENKNEEEDKNKEETDEQKAARLAKEKEDRKELRLQRKWDRLAGEKKAAEDRVKALEAQLAEKPAEGLTEEEVARRAEDLANQKLQQKQIQDAQKEFEKNCDNLEAAATKADKEFPKKVSELAEELGPIPSPVISILSDLDNENGGEVLAYLANNVDEAEDLFELRTNPAKLAIKLTRISDKLKDAKKAPKRERSNLPAPITPVNESGGKDTGTKVTGKESMEEFVRKRNAADKARRDARGY